MFLWSFSDRRRRLERLYVDVQISWKAQRFWTWWWYSTCSVFVAGAVNRDFFEHVARFQKPEEVSSDPAFFQLDVVCRSAVSASIRLYLSSYVATVSPTWLPHVGTTPADRHV